MCLTYETHLAGVIYHSAPLLLSEEKGSPGGSATRQTPTLRWGGGWGCREGSWTPRSLKIPVFSKLMNAFVCSSKLGTVARRFPLFWKFFWEKMSKSLLDMGLVSQSWWGFHQARCAPVIPGLFGKPLVYRVSAAIPLASERLRADGAFSRWTRGD